MTNKYMRIIHRYLGFFLIGIMSVYALSGIVLIFRNTDFLKNETTIQREIGKNIPNKELGRSLRQKNFKVLKEENNTVFFKNGEYNKQTGVANYTTKELPYALHQMTKLHKANSDHPLFWLNIFFGVSLLFFSISSFWMFMPKTAIFKKGMWFTLGGIVLTLALLFI
ncbi:hypothetical protein AXE80_07480 [Wenyingzhuangia fucanilytica]|uniref:Peptidase n=1 Tax=Wenyingzhuangia fucanilytica TaxID=1790137 RepID=A0A1B1Y5V5_9FLAO|nr:hypothetical protein [Wenyingzhuangia fucanilytica]ANW96127.1 hypothetical protein AXE80_07480 [Wenyingzhuangia fucanilytica]